MQKYNKFVVALLAALVAGLTQVIGDGEMSNADWITVSAMLLGAVVTYFIPNLPSGSTSESDKPTRM